MTSSLRGHVDRDERQKNQGLIAKPLTFERYKNQRELFPQNGVYTSTKLIRENPDMVRRYMRAYTEAIQYYKTHKEDTIKIMRKYSRLDDRKVLEEA